MAVRRYGIYLADFDLQSRSSIGTVHYGIGLASSLPEHLDADEALVVYASPDVADLLDPHPQVHIERVPRSSGTKGRLLTEQRDSVAVARRDGLAVLHFLKGMVPLRRVAGTAYVVTVHDDIPLQYVRGHFDTHGSFALNAYVSTQILWSLWRADAVITVSEAASEALSRYARRRPVSVSEGLTVPDEPVVPIADREPLVLVFASGLPHKRTEALLRTLSHSSVVEEHGWRIGLIGPTRPAGTDDLDLDDLGTPSSEELHRLVRHSRLVAFHSTYEGLGLPPLESWALGTPAVRPALPSLDEALEGVPGRVDHLDVACLDRALAEVAALDDPAVASLRQLVRSRFSWPDVAGRVLEEYRAVAG